MSVPAFAHDYPTGEIVYGRGCVASLGDALASRGLDRALVVTGRTVGTTDAVIDPVTDGLGDRLASVFAHTTPQKRLATALDGVRSCRENDVDVLVGLGGGSSRNVAKAIAALAALDATVDEIAALVEDEGELPSPAPDRRVIPSVAVPTTLAGADLSVGGSVLWETPDGDDRALGVRDERLMPTALFYDPSLFATTPMPVLAGSAMNGFDKGLEMVYSRHANPITDATALRGLRYLGPGLKRLRQGDPEALDACVAGVILVQHGAWHDTLSVIHAFGHALSRFYDVQQGAVHGIMAPHALRYLFDAVDARRDVLAEALDVDGDGDQAAAVVAEVTAIRDALDVPTRLRSIPDLARSDLAAVAGRTAEDGFMTNVPAGVDATPAALESVLEAAW